MRADLCPGIYTVADRDGTRRQSQISKTHMARNGYEYLTGSSGSEETNILSDLSPEEDLRVHVSHSLLRRCGSVQMGGFGLLQDQAFVSLQSGHEVSQ